MANTALFPVSSQEEWPLRRWRGSDSAGVLEAGLLFTPAKHHPTLPTGKSSRAFTSGPSLRSDWLLEIEPSAHPPLPRWLWLVGVGVGVGVGLNQR